VTADLAKAVSANVKVVHATVPRVAKAPSLSSANLTARVQNALRLNLAGQSPTPKGVKGSLSGSATTTSLAATSRASKVLVLTRCGKMGRVTKVHVPTRGATSHALTDLVVISLASMAHVLSVQIVPHVHIQKRVVQSHTPKGVKHVQPGSAMATSRVTMARVPISHALTDRALTSHGQMGHGQMGHGQMGPAPMARVRRRRIAQAVSRQVPVRVQVRQLANATGVVRSRRSF
jgi:hypothetical protein